MKKAQKSSVEKFDSTDLNGLRQELLKAGLDSWQAADLISSFLAARGYGVSTQAARRMASHLEIGGCTINCLQHELEKLAQVM
jgi:uncharacterized metal-binding protein